jgi:hypothetical protein
MGMKCEAEKHATLKSDSSGATPSVSLPTPTLPVYARRKIYVASSWRNPIQQDIVLALRKAGHEVYDFRNPAPGNSGFAWSEVNPDWLQWTPEQFIEDLYSGHPSVERGFAFDKKALDWCDTCVLVLPCGRSAHLEAGYAAGQGKLTMFVLHPDKFEPELMYRLGRGCVTCVEDLLDGLNRHTPLPPVTLTRRQAAAVIRLLGTLQTHLESAIESCLVEGESEPRDESDRESVAEDRREWKEAEAIIQAIEPQVRRCR